MTTKITDANIDSDNQDKNAFNISLLGFKMAVNEGLTVFNLVDGVVDEFNDESGTDEAEGSNDYYQSANDFYTNNSTPLCNSAGFTMTTTTEPDTSTAGTNPGYSTATPATYTVPTCISSVGVYIWGAGGSGSGSASNANSNGGGGGGFSSGNLSVTAGQTLKIIAGEGGARDSGSVRAYFRGGVGSPAPSSGNGGGLSVVHTGCIPGYPVPGAFVPSLYMIAGSGGGSAGGFGGSGGGLQGDVGRDQNEQTSAIGYAPPGVDFENGGGGSQSQGGQGGIAEGSGTANSGELLIGGDGNSLNSCQQGGGGGAGYYGGGGGTSHPQGYGSGGGGSAYIGNPLVSCGSTEEGGGSPATRTGGGTTSPLYVACGPGTPVGNGDGGFGPQNPDFYDGGDGYVLITTSGNLFAQPGGGSSTIVSSTFTSTSVATSARMVVFEEDVDTPTLNTDIVASVSRDGGATFTNATLSDSGYVTGSSGQRILTGQADISGQPSGQSMRWKLALANNTVKIHGVSLQWS